MSDNRYLFSLQFADSSLIMGHRLSEWTGHGPLLEQDMAITNIALDFIGQARNFYQYAAELSNILADKQQPITEDDLAYLRREHEYLNNLITELPNGDWSQTILKIFLFSMRQYFIYGRLIYSDDKTLAAIAEKSLKEVTYHVKWSGDWVIRLGDGTKESHERIEKSLAYLWPYTGDLLEPEDFMEGIFEKPAGTILQEVKTNWLAKVSETLREATLNIPSNDIWKHKGAVKGTHTEHLGYILAELQFMQRAYPGCEW